ncbi:hypothetical protein KL935_000332 [Ogataea polymorpha]|nr:hypothetical protein KL935_000332 [Ogataea polymorpha]
MTTELASYSSVYVSAASVFDSATSVLATVTAEASSKSLAIIVEQAKATMSYYSLAQAAATITDPGAASSASAEAAVASAIMKELFDDNSFYGGNAPSLGGNIALLVVMSVFLAMQVVYGAIYRNWWFFTCFTCGLILEVLGYCGRIWSSQNIMSFNGYVLQLVCLTLAPCFIMAGIYYTIGEMTIIMGQMYSLLKPMQYSLIFIMCDITALVLQAIGGGVASNALSLFESTRGGADIMRQVFLVYIGFISLAVIFVFIRSIYRLIELAQGFSGHLAVTEIYFFILEALMMALAICLMLITYPGAVYGRNTKIEVDKSVRGLFENTWCSSRLHRKDPVEPAEPDTHDKEKASEPL